MKRSDRSTLEIDSAKCNLRPSQFNEYLGNIGDEKWVLYNNLSGAMIEVDKRMYDLIREGSIHNIDNEKTIETLKYGKFIVEGATDEIGVIKKFKHDVVQSVPVIGMQIVPTLGCNFSCIYCYQACREKEKVIMSKEVMDAIIEYTKQKIEPTTQFLNVLWFGGEPLLAIDRIKYLSQSFIEITASKKMKYFSGIITNGYLLHESSKRFTPITWND